MGLVVVQSNDRNGCVVSVLPKRHLEKPFVWDVERYLVHQLVLIGFNDCCSSLYRMCSRKCSGSSRAYCFITINPCVVQCGCSHISKIRFWFVQNRLKLTFFFVQFHSWKLSTKYWDMERLLPRLLAALGNRCCPRALHPSIHMPDSVGLENEMFILVPLVLRFYLPA